MVWELLVGFLILSEEKGTDTRMNRGDIHVLFVRRYVLPIVARDLAYLLNQIEFANWERRGRFAAKCLPCVEAVCLLLFW